MARALTAVSVKGNYLTGKYWSDLYRRAAVEPEPPAEPFTEYLQNARSMPEAEIEAGLNQALNAQTSLTDTHPCLIDRLRPLGIKPSWPEPISQSAGQALLGPFRKQLIENTNEKWAITLAAEWRAAHAKGAAERAKLDELGARSTSLENRELVELAHLSERHQGTASAVSWLDAAIATRPDYAPALFTRGRIRLARGDEGGVSEIEEAMLLDGNLVEPGSQILYNHFISRRDTVGGQKHLNTLTRMNAIRAAAVAERRTISKYDTFSNDGITAEVIKLIVSACAKNKRVLRAWIARKVVRHFPEQPLYVLVLDCGWGRRRLRKSELDEIDRTVSEAAVVVFDKRPNAKLAKQIIRGAGDAVYKRK